MFRVLVFLILFPFSVAAGQVPATLFDVTDVASDDVLNIRATPSSESDILGGLAYDAKRIEILALSDDEKWGQVSQMGVVGWVYLRFLEPTRMTAAQTFGEPQSIFCSGDEPYWSLDLFGNQAAFARSDEPVQAALATRWTDQPSGQDTHNRVFIAQGQAASLSGIIRHEACTTPDSEPQGDMTVSLIFSSSEHAFLTGCCRLRE